MTVIMVEKTINDLEKEQYTFEITADHSIGIRTRLQHYKFYRRQTKRHKYKSVKGQEYSWLDRQSAKYWNRQMPAIPLIPIKIIEELKKLIVEDLIIDAE